MSRNEIYKLIEKERCSQDKKFGTGFDDSNTANDWITYINTYASRASSDNVQKRDLKEFKNNMIKVAALAVAAIERVECNKELPLTPRNFSYSRGF